MPFVEALSLGEVGVEDGDLVDEGVEAGFEALDGLGGEGDFGDEEYKEMVCVEAAAIDEPVKVKPKASWIGEQTLEAVINLAHFSV